MGELETRRAVDTLSSGMGLGGGTPLIGMPQPQYSLIKTGNAEIDLMLSKLLMQAVGNSGFLPQQLPAQNLLDQMIAQKYMTTQSVMAAKMRELDTKTLGERMIQGRQNMLGTPLTDLGKAQIRNSAGMLNDQFTKQIFSMLMGPQLMEDVFFGKRGSAEMLGTAIGSIGFARPDSVTGAERMTGESLETFTKQIYANLYGPSANLNDISGFSAGRTGTIALDLARRGLLPPSLRQLTAAERQAEMRANSADVGKLGISADITTALNAGEPIENIAKLEGGADAIRKIDATRVSNTLKEYAKAVSTVREIFGDNGISDAPMSQLMAALEALTQNSMSSVGAGRLEGIVRRTQMAAKGSGVSLEGLLALNARAGALADQNNLPRQFAAENSALAMERVQAMRDSGGFKPGFGRVDPDKAALVMLDQNMRADASPYAKYVAAAQRAVTSGLVDIKDAKNAKLVTMLNTIRSGQTKMRDPDSGKTIDIYEELGKNPSDFLGPMFDAAGLSSDLLSAFYDDPNTLKALDELPGRQMYRMQPAEIREKMASSMQGSNVTRDALQAAGKVPETELDSLNNSLSRAFTATALDTVNSQMTEKEQEKALRDAMRAVFTQKIIESGAASSVQEAEAQAERQLVDSFGGENELKQFIHARYANLGASAKREFGQSLPELQQTFNKKQQDAAALRTTTNMSRAMLFDNLRSSGSNMYQRLSDTIFEKRDGSVVDAILGVVDRGSVVDAIKGTLGADDEERKTAKARIDAVFNQHIKNSDDLIINTDAERDAFIAKVAAEQKRAGPNAAEPSSALDAIREQLNAAGAANVLDGKTSYTTTDEVAKEISNKFGPGGESERLKTATSPEQIARRTELQTAELNAKNIFKETTGQELDLKNPEHIKKLAEIANIDTELNLFGGKSLTEGTLRAALNTHRVFNATGDDLTKAVSKQNAFRGFTSGLQTGTFAAEDVFNMFEIEQDDETTKALGAFFDAGETKDLDAAVAKLASRGIDSDKIKDVQFFARFGRAIKAAGGLDQLGIAGAKEQSKRLSRADAIIQASQGDKATLKADGKIVDLAKKYASSTASTEERDEFEKYVANDEQLRIALGHDVIAGEKNGERVYGADGSFGSKTEAINKILENSNAKNTDFLQMLGGMGGALSGFGGALSGIGASIATAVKDAFAGEVKIQTASIERLELKSAQTDAQTKFVTAAAAASPETKAIALSGTVQIGGDLKTAVLNLIATSRPRVEFPPGSGSSPIVST